MTKKETGPLERLLSKFEKPFSRFDNNHINMSDQQKLRSFSNFLILEKGLENKSEIFLLYDEHLRKKKKENKVGKF